MVRLEALRENGDPKTGRQWEAQKTRGGPRDGWDVEFGAVEFQPHARVSITSRNSGAAAALRVVGKGRISAQRLLVGLLPKLPLRSQSRSLQAPTCRVSMPSLLTRTI